MRRVREEFRKKLVSLIMSSDAELELDQNEFPNAEEKEMLRYNYFIKHGIDTVHVAPMNTKALNKYFGFLSKLIPTVFYNLLIKLVKF